MIAAKVGVSRPTVIAWRNRYASQGIAGLQDEAQSGRPRTLDHREIVAETLKPPPNKYGVTHWSSRLLGQHLKISNGTVARTTTNGTARPRCSPHWNSRPAR